MYAWVCTDVSGSSTVDVGDANVAGGTVLCSLRPCNTTFGFGMDKLSRAIF